MNGYNFQKRKPYVSVDADWKEFLYSMPFQAYTCWNAMVVFAADVFQRHGVRFRQSHMGECTAAETEFIGRDLWEIDRGNIIVSPAGAASYNEHAFQRCVLPKQPSALRSVPRIRFAKAPLNATCCWLRKGASVVNFKKCFWEPSGRNHSISAYNLSKKWIDVQNKRFPGISGAKH
eukprot:gnl/MRDRNA2_/MRDRNA2_235224_c0_seq1.p1 gnl/MRDRNA2_/MRDRNA2_235224_c0~~gnl/MRDRNA2_/MRDRNA2_235224_c0_seq1.p1  ORF type:complete len:176 (-),score=19.79 gnl/MRDRNA2_/MRDRNA2_235224_c0_seq1:404-931(-)